MVSKEDIVEKVSALRIRYQKSAAWKISALEAADSMKETVAIAFMSEDDAGALEMIEAMMEKYGELPDLVLLVESCHAWRNSYLPKNLGPLLLRQSNESHAYPSRPFIAMSYFISFEPLIVLAYARCIRLCCLALER